MRKDDWVKVKRAYEITIKGCGKDCLLCERDICLSDTREIRRQAKRYIKQKAVERKHYQQNRLRLNAAAKARYNRLYKVANPMECRKLKNDLLILLPAEFSYELAGKIWQVEYSCARERIKRFMERGLVDKRRVGLQVICFKTEKYDNAISLEADNECRK